MLDVEVITQPERFDELEPIWNPLLAASRADTLFLTFEWLRTWWRHYGDGKDLCILLFCDGQTPVGIAPLYKARRSFGAVEEEMVGSRRMLLPAGRGLGFLEVAELQFLGTGAVCSDFLDVFCLPDREAEVADRMIDYLLSTLQDWDLLNLLEIPEHSPFLARIHERWSGVRRRYRRLPRYTAYHAPLPGDYEEFLSSLSRKSRYNARKKLREVERRFPDLELRWHTDPATLSEAMDQFIALHTERLNEEAEPGVFTDPAFTGFHKEMAAIGLARGWLRLGFLLVQGRREFGLYSYHYGDRIFFYQQGGGTSHPQLNLGYAALALAIRDAIAEGARAYDFLRGEARYKSHWAKAVRRQAQIQFIRPGFRGTLFRLHSAVNASPRLRRRIKRLLPGGGRG